VSSSTASAGSGGFADCDPATSRRGEEIAAHSSDAPAGTGTRKMCGILWNVNVTAENSQSYAVASLVDGIVG